MHKLVNTFIPLYSYQNISHAVAWHKFKPFISVGFMFILFHILKMINLKLGQYSLNLPISTQH